jgi:N-acetylglucosaminyl-diphospho-decaprenol L-rhamnosyltransferase
MAEVAVAVVSWNTRELLGACLDSLREDHDAGRAEVWVVDNGSRDGSAAMVRERFPWVALQALEDNLGFGAAVNLVARQTETPWIAPANADVSLERGALAKLIEAGSSDRRSGVLAPRLLLPDGSTQHSVYRFPTLPFTLLFNSSLHLAARGIGER